MRNPSKEEEGVSGGTYGSPDLVGRFIELKTINLVYEFQRLSIVTNPSRSS